jgi:hypothetical protein
MDRYKQIADWLLEAYLLNPAGPTEFWLKLLAGILIGATVLNVLCGVLKLGDNNYATSIVLFVVLTLGMLAFATVAHVHLGHLLRGQDRWVSAALWSTLGTFLVSAPILKAALRTGYGSALTTWLVSWFTTMLLVLLVGGVIHAFGAGASAVKSEKARTSEATKLINSSP